MEEIVGKLSWKELMQIDLEIKNESKYGGGGVDNVINKVHYHTLGRTINMNNSAPQSEISQQAALCERG